MLTDSESRKLVDLKVADLRTELEKRNLDRTGVKAILIERLENVLKDEGHDPDTYLFPVTSSAPSTPLSKGSPLKKGGRRNGEGDEAVEVSEGADKVVKEEKEMKVKEEEEEVVEEGGEKSGLAVNETKVVKGEKEEDNNKKTPPIRRPAPASVKKARAAAAAIVKDEVKKEVKSEMNGTIENEDSINLTIGEDDEMLAEEEERMQEKENKDDSNRTTGQRTLVAGAAGAGAVGDKKTTSSAADPHLQSSATKSPEKDNSQEKPDPKSSAPGDTKQTGDDKKTATARRRGSFEVARNLWVSGLSSSTRATDLKQIFSKHGKVVGAKVVTNAKTPGARCYGYVTMATGEDATLSVEKLHLSELHGRMISVEKAKGESSWPPRKTEDAHTDSKRRPASGTSSQRDVEKKEEKLVPPGTEDEEVENEESKRLNGEPAVPGKEDSEQKERRSSNRDRSRDRAGAHQSRDRSRRGSRPGSRHRSQHSREVLSFSKIKEEQERQRLKERGRETREEERRRRMEEEKQRMIDFKQRRESIRLERERQQLKREREKIERERAELLKLERERQKLERERLQREKYNLKREQFAALRRIEEERRGTKRPRDCEDINFAQDRKRPAQEVRSSTRYNSSSNNSRYENPSASYQPPPRLSQKDRRSTPPPSQFNRYESNSKGDSDRYRDSRGGGDNWHGGGGGGQSNMKSYGAQILPPSGGHGRETSWISERKPDPPQQWRAPPNSSERWVSSGGPINMNRVQPAMGPGMYPNAGPAMIGQPMGVMPQSLYGGERFDAYKQPVGPMGRKF